MEHRRRSAHGRRAAGRPGRARPPDARANEAGAGSARQARGMGRVRRRHRACAADARVRAVVPRLRKGVPQTQAAGLRRPAPAGRPDVREGTCAAEPLCGAIPACAGRRIPGSEPRPRATCRADRPRCGSFRRRRRRPIDLPIPRRVAGKPRTLPGQLSGSEHDHARPQSPQLAPHRRRRRGADQRQHRPAAEAASRGRRRTIGRDLGVS